MWFVRRTDNLKFAGLNEAMTNADVKVEVATAMTSYLASQDFKDSIAKAVKEAVGQAMESVLKELKAEIAVLEGKVKTLEGTIKKVAAKANDNEQFSRPQNVRVMGFVKEDDENRAETFVNLCREKIGLDVNYDLVDTAHRVSKKEEGTNRAIIIRLKTRKDKQFYATERILGARAFISMKI